MIASRKTLVSRCIGPLAFMALSATAVEAQRAVLPEGSVIIVRTTAPLESNRLQTGQTFETIVADTVQADNYTLIPAGSRIRGVVTFAQAATRQQSGVVELSFDRLLLPGGQSLPMSGKLTSTDAAERRQIEASPDPRVVLVGGRGGVGAVIAGAGSERSPASGILAALGGLLSQAQDVRVPTGTVLAVQLEQQLVLSRRGGIRRPDATTIYTAADRIRAAQQALARQNYYRGSITGQLDDATQRALFEFQVDKGIIATGNLDGRTATALGITETGASGGGTGAAVLTAEEASTMRRGAQAIVGRYRQDMAVSATGRLDPRRTYSQEDMELWFALSGFADNTSLYEQLVRVQGNTQGSEPAGRALVAAARRVDAAMQRARGTQAVQNAWMTLRSQLAELDPSYR
jgi:hypothetical protein